LRAAPLCSKCVSPSAFSAILVYAQELLPGKVGLIAGLFCGLAFGMGGLGSTVLGRLADLTSIVVRIGPARRPKCRRRARI
jgi:FSR family fosmidomycin resistance protein-like MFS transporter